MTLSLRLLTVFMALSTLVGTARLAAQELNCTVTLNAEQVEGTNRQIFETLEQAMNDYMNTTTFTNTQFATNEKIECRLFFTIKEVKDDVFSGDLQVQSLRPVYNSSYTTTLINFRDTKIEFTYRENEPLVFSVNNMESQLTAILNFYAYLILAVDFDSFSPHGGDPYFDRLQLIVQQAQSSGESGWKAFEDTKNRSSVLGAYTDPATSGIRDMTYSYHRQGLDNMAVSVDKGRSAVTESLSAIEKVYKVAPMSVALSMFKDAKLDELVNIYSKAPAEERNKVYKLLEPIYPTEQTRLEEIKKGADNK
ncbi:MAG: DUF4835 family protein [Muribaculaceae bacterium]|nr:DUF4835 family protein [Muribaculaceae bacterium]